MTKDELIADMKRLSEQGGSSLYMLSEIARFVLQQDAHIRELERRLDACDELLGEERVPR